jgi:outer membrane receptor protein involved in Fe transport
MAINLNWNFSGTSTRWDVYDNEVSSEVVTDARVNYTFDTANGRLGLFLNVNNLFGRDPEEFLNAAFSSNFSTGTGLGVTGEGDRGRRFTVGVRLDFGS